MMWPTLTCFETWWIREIVPEAWKRRRGKMQAPHPKLCIDTSSASTCYRRHSYSSRQCYQWEENQTAAVFMRESSPSSCFRTGQRECFWKRFVLHILRNFHWVCSTPEQAIFSGRFSHDPSSFLLQRLCTLFYSNGRREQHHPFLLAHMLYTARGCYLFSHFLSSYFPWNVMFKLSQIHTCFSVPIHTHSNRLLARVSVSMSASPRYHPALLRTSLNCITCIFSILLLFWWLIIVLAAISKTEVK